MLWHIRLKKRSIFQEYENVYLESTVYPIQVKEHDETYLIAWDYS